MFKHNKIKPKTILPTKAYITLYLYLTAIALIAIKD